MDTCGYGSQRLRGPIHSTRRSPRTMVADGTHHDHTQRSTSTKTSQPHGHRYRGCSRDIRPPLKISTMSLFSSGQRFRRVRWPQMRCPTRASRRSACQPRTRPMPTDGPFDERRASPWVSRSPPWVYEESGRGLPLLATDPDESSHGFQRGRRLGPPRREVPSRSMRGGMPTRASDLAELAPDRSRNGPQPSVTVRSLSG